MIAAVAAVILSACGSSSSSSAGSGGSGTAASSSGGSSSSSGTINLGVISDQTGPTSATQLPFLHGIETYINKTNAQGGVNGQKIHLDLCDEKYDVTAGLACYQTLVKQDKVSALVGSLNDSDVQAALIPKITQDKIPVIGAESTNQEALIPFNKYFFAMECPYPDQADVAVQYEKELTGVAAPKVASMTLSVSSGIEWSQLIKERVTKAGGSLVGAFPIPPTATNADVVVQKMAALHPTWITVHGGPNISEILLKSMQKFGLQVPVVGIFATGGHLPFQSVSPTYAKLFHYVNCYTPADVTGPGTTQMVADAQKYGGYGAEAQTNDPFTNGYVVGMATVAGLKNIPSGTKVDSASIVTGMEKVNNLDTMDLSPNVTFGPNLRVGVIGLRPYGWDATTKKIVAVGTYDHYKSAITGEWLPPQSKYVLSSSAG
ncbi:MAG TPA: ABC transporter substrate-binding protein [Solirubrobacteraceae bacterium]|nr:ABC transporter substrate-binding protein [Solirubrobacteraceae bacterium]